MFIYNHPVYPRRSWERIFKQLYNTGLVLNFGAFIITVTDFASRMDSTYASYWAASTFQLNSALAKILSGCTYQSDFTMNQLTASVKLNTDSLPFMAISLTSLIVGIFAIHGLMIIWDFLAKILFAMNIRHLRIGGVLIRINYFLVIATVLHSVALIAMIAASKSSLNFVQNYIQSCTRSFTATNQAEFVDAEYDVDTVFGLNLNITLAAVIVNLFVYFFAVLFQLGYSMRESNARILALKYPWEKGFLCRPIKPILVEYTTLRKQLEDEVMSPNFNPAHSDAAMRVRRLGQTMPQPESEIAQRFRDEFGAEEIIVDDDMAMEDMNGDDMYDDAQGDGDALDDITNEAREEKRRRRRHRHRSRPNDDDDRRSRRRRGNGDQENVGANMV